MVAAAHRAAVSCWLTRTDYRGKTSVNNEAMEACMTTIQGLHHNAYRCRDSEETRVFFEDFLGLPLVSAFEIDEGRALHTFFQMADGSCLAFLSYRRILVMG